VLEILVNEGDTVSVGTPMVVIGESGEAPATVAEAEVEEETVAPPAADRTSAVNAPAGEAPAGPPVSSPGTEATLGEVDRPKAETEGVTPQPTDDREVEAFFAQPDETEKKPHLLSPVVRKLIRENELDVSQLAGSGQGGRITRKDVEAYIASGAPTAVAPPAPAPETVPPPSPAPAVEPAAPIAPAVTAVPPPPAPPAAPPGEEVELTRLRVRAAENLIRAKQTAAHVWTSVEVDYERLERVRQEHKDDFKKAEGFSLTYLPFIARATIDALREFPVVNSSFDLEGKKAVFHKKLDLGIAVDLNQEGLVVARIRNADGLRLVGIARQIKEMADGARSGTLSVDDLTGSTFTITNPGPFGSFMSAPIINVPNVAILSTDTVSKRATVITTSDGQDMIAIRHIGYLGLSWDHRAFDGSTAVLFLQRIKQNLETWDWEQELA
jgi:2-oxoglutarate dehydrogenase E2 component (dihydrolipoamide succinyltransferase)